MLRQGCMKTLWAIPIIALAFPSLSSAQITFERYYDAHSVDCGSCVQQTSDEGYIIAGGTEPGCFAVYLMKTGSLGDTVWTRTYIRGSYSRGYCVQQTLDGGYIIAGLTHTGGGMTDVYLIKTDSSGDTAWTRTYGGSDCDAGYWIQQTSDGAYLVAGSTSSFGAGSGDVYLLKMDSSGDTLWTRTYGGTGADEGTSVQQTLGGGYVIAGSTSSFGAGNSDVYLIKTDSSGDTLWTRTYGDTDVDRGSSVQQTSDGGYIVAGSTSSFGAGSTDVYMIRTDSSGDTLWTRTYGGASVDAGRSVRQTSDGGYIIAGYTLSFGAGEYDVYLVKADSLGDMLWTRTYGGSLFDWAYSVQETSDGGFIVAGETASFTPDTSDVYLIKTDGDGLLGVEEESADLPSDRSGLELLQARPNPLSRSTAIIYSLSAAGAVSLKVYDVAGQLVETLVSKTQAVGVHRVVWGGKNEPSGIYFCRLVAGDLTATRKLVILR